MTPREYDRDGLYVHGPRRTTPPAVDAASAPAPGPVQSREARQEIRRTLGDVLLKGTKVRRTVSRLQAAVAGQTVSRTWTPSVKELRAAVAGRSVRRNEESWYPTFAPPGPAPYTRDQRDAGREAFRRAKLSGKLKAPDACECCKRTTVGIHGHHTDYTKPLDVLWLCALCHRLAHGYARPAHLLKAG